MEILTPLIAEGPDSTLGVAVLGRDADSFGNIRTMGGREDRLAYDALTTCV